MSNAPGNRLDRMTTTTDSLGFWANHWPRSHGLTVWPAALTVADCTPAHPWKLHLLRTYPT